MNKEELIGKLQMVYVGDKNALNELICYYDGLKQVTEELQQENKQLKEELKYTVPIVEHNKIVSKKLKENQKYKEVIDKAINDLNIIIDIVREKPLGSDCWIIDRLEANKSILKEVE